MAHATLVKTGRLQLPSWLREHRQYLRENLLEIPNWPNMLKWKGIGYVGMNLRSFILKPIRRTGNNTEQTHIV
jgi:hypothetical protein